MAAHEHTPMTVKTSGQIVCSRCGKVLGYVTFDDSNTGDGE